MPRRRRYPRRHGTIALQNREGGDGKVKRDEVGKKDLRPRNIFVFIQNLKGSNGRTMSRQTEVHVNLQRRKTFRGRNTRIEKLQKKLEKKENP